MPVEEDYLAANGVRSVWLFTIARWACIPLSLLGGYVCFCWAGDLYGSRAAAVALALWCFCPNILAHAQLITPDAGAAALGVAAAYLFWRWLRRPGWPRALGAGLVLGLAELTKTAWIVAFALWPILWLGWNWPWRRELSRGAWRRQTPQLATILLVSIGTVNLGYMFEGSFQRLGGLSPRGLPSPSGRLRSCSRDSSS